MSDASLSRAKEILEKILYVTVATASKDGQPWNSPVYAAFDENYNFFWASDHNGQHSKNIRENENVFLVIYDSTAPEGTGEGVYIKATAHELSDEAEIQRGSDLLQNRVGKTDQYPPQHFLENMPLRIYKAVPEKVWINGEGDVNGNYIDVRIEVDLLKKK